MSFAPVHNDFIRNGNIVCGVCTGTPDHLMTLHSKYTDNNMELFPPLLLLQQLSRKDFRVSVEISAHSSSTAFVRSGTYVGWEGLVCNLYSSSSQRSSMRALKFFQTKLIQSCLNGPWCTVMLEEKRAFPKLFPQRWKHSKIIWYAKTLSFPITVCKGPALNLKTVPYHYPPPNFTVGTM